MKYIIIVPDGMADYPLEELGNKTRTALTYINIATVYADSKNNDKALEYYFAALKINEEIGDIEGIAFSLYDIGHV